jgi:predicted aminopeptidase
VRVVRYADRKRHLAHTLLRRLLHAHPRTRWLLLALALSALLASCRTVHFYSQAALGQAQIFWRSERIPDVLLKEGTKPSLCARLQLVQGIRSYAGSALGLPSEASFGKYADLGRRYVSWVVYAAPEFSVEPKTWWYPLVGRLQYRGFFSEEAAKAEAETLKAQGLDVFCGGVEAYSTLGWFHDPVLNTFVNRDEAELAELIFHELTHVKLFIPGDTDFNEALATAVGQEGVRRWLRSRGEQQKLASYEASLQKDAQIVQLLLQTRQQLEQSYAQKGATPEQLHAVKVETFARMNKRYASIRAQWQGDSRYDRYFAKPMNNARLNTVAAYHQLVPVFEAKLKALDGDLERFFTEMEKMKKTKSLSGQKMDQ